MKDYVAIIVTTSIAIVGLFSLPSFISYHGKTDAGFLQGKVSQEFESHYNEELPVRDISLNTWTAAQYLLFNQGRDGVVIGDEDWLYTEEEFNVYHNMNSRYNIRLSQIKQIQDMLLQRNIELLFVLLPAKARIYKHFIQNQYRQESLDGTYEKIHSAIVNIGIHSPDIYKVFSDTKDEQLFFRTDTHWTPKGASLCAVTIAEYFDEHIRPNIHLNTTQNYVTFQREGRPHAGDLLNFLPLGFYSEWIGPKRENIVIHVTEKVFEDSVSSNELFGEVGIDFALVGSSYSANSLWNFEGFLKQSLKTDIVNYAEEGAGPLIPMVKYLKSDDFKNNPPKVVIWEFPERYFPVEYEEVSSFFKQDETFDISYINY